MILAIDLGTTNIKAGLYDEALSLLALNRAAVRYSGENGRVEFDADEYYETILSLVAECLSSPAARGHTAQIVLTGQAESLVVLGKDMRPLCNGISWMDNRGGDECEELRSRFSGGLRYETTGQPELTCTFPIVKMLWIRRHLPDLFRRAGRFLLLKDYVQYRLTGVIAGEHSIYNFSHYFDIRRKAYWNEILDYCGVDVSQLPELVEPGTLLGTATEETLVQLGIDRRTTVNVGAVDQFCAMLGTGNIAPGTLSESCGTVMALATMLKEPVSAFPGIGVHCGPLRNSYVALLTCESGGSCLEWYRDNFLAGQAYGEIDRVCESRQMQEELLFLPYLIGTNAPEYNPRLSGVFFGLRGYHDRFDLARAVMEGVACLLRRNIDALGKYADGDIVATGGAAKSRFWCQLKADFTGRTVKVAKTGEAASLGAAMMGAVSGGMFTDIGNAIQNCVRIEWEYPPSENGAYERKYRQYSELLSLVASMKKG